MVLYQGFTFDFIEGEMHEKSPFTFQVTIAMINMNIMKIKKTIRMNKKNIMMIMMNIMKIMMNIMMIKMNIKMIKDRYYDDDNAWLEHDYNYDDEKKLQDFFKQRKRWMQGIYMVCRYYSKSQSIQIGADPKY